MIERYFKIQIEAKWNDITGTIDHVSSYLVKDATWSVSELDSYSWQQP